MTDMLAAREVEALRREVAEWRAGVEAANRISQRERERAERAEAERDAMAARLASVEAFCCGPVEITGPDLDIARQFKRNVEAVLAHVRALAAPQPKETPCP